MANAYNFSKGTRKPTEDGPPVEPPTSVPTIVEDPDFVLNEFSDNGPFRLRFTPSVNKVTWRVVLGPVPYNFIPNLDQSRLNWNVSYVNGSYYHTFRYADPLGFTYTAGTQLSITGGVPNKLGDSDATDVKIGQA